MKTMINVKTDKEVKEDAQRIAHELGLPLSTVINAYLKEFIRHGEVRFSLEPQLRPEVEKLLKKASEDYRRSRNVRGPFSSTRDMDAYLDSR